METTHRPVYTLAAEKGRYSPPVTTTSCFLANERLRQINHYTLPTVKPSESLASYRLYQVDRHSHSRIKASCPVALGRLNRQKDRSSQSVAATHHSVYSRTTESDTSPPSDCLLRRSSEISQPVDPDELHARLSLVLAEQNDKEKASSKHEWFSRQRSKADNQCQNGVNKDSVRHTSHLHNTKLLERLHLPRYFSKPPPARDGRDDQKSSPGYRHVPQVAAVQFALTTTVDIPAERQRIYRTQSLRELPSVRNQLQFAPALATMAEDDERRPRRCCSHLFKSRESLRASFLEPTDSRQRRPRSQVPSGHDTHHRRTVYWTQSDEGAVISLPAASSLSTSQVEGKETIRRRLSTLMRSCRQEKCSQPGGEMQPLIKSCKTARVNFFSRFGR
ncbi:hypothetical protein CDD81_6473 [Ophiocordyceps australis]|uniref:Uncharacterized protein n=1 Tax=Ophiocordyceps australis TaxID=1399860 RepID=A0A2C5YG05_9HYPO|nr:hypothetical protein CDD81_6473 [Ophiocordyceps australis]